MSCNDNVMAKLFNCLLKEPKKLVEQKVSAASGQAWESSSIWNVSI